ncbi:MAG: alpha/beta hydrolase domain-containing protein [Thermodesulfobacteriota bacterium]
MLLAIGGCSDSSSSTSGPAADLAEELTGGSGPFIGEAVSPRLEDFGYVQREYVAAGTASSYRAVGALGADGRWTFEPELEAPYRTRVLVRRPADAADFSGTVIVEWLNVSGGVDAGPDYTSLEEEIVRRGHAWVGVSAQLIGVEGGPVLVIAPGAEGLAGRGLKGLDPARYGSLAHPGDGFSFDIFTQAARALRAGDGLGGLRPDVVLAAGESQSAIALVTYYDGVQPLTGAFDGFLVHSRASVGLPLVTLEQRDALEDDGRRDFDLVYARFLLSHVRSPAAALARMRRALRPGALLVVEDVDFPGHFCHPPCAAFARYVELYVAAARLRGADATIGPRLPGLLREAGLEAVGVDVVQPAFVDGDGKRIAQLTMAGIRDAVVAAGLATGDEVDALVAELDAYRATPGTVETAARIVRAWGTSAG